MAFEKQVCSVLEILARPFFTLILDDVIQSYTTYIASFFALLGIHYFFTATARMILLTKAKRRLKKGLVSYNTLIIGGNQKAMDLYEEIKSMKLPTGNNFVGFIDSNGNSKNELAKYLPILGKIKDIHQVIKEQEIEEAIIAIETSDHNKIKEILNALADFEEEGMNVHGSERTDIMTTIDEEMDKSLLYLFTLITAATTTRHIIKLLSWHFHIYIAIWIVLGLVEIVKPLV